MILPKLLVEGKDDLYAIAELLQRHSVDMSEPNRPLTISIARDPTTNAEGVVPLLATMADAIRNASDRPIGIVLDVDVPTVDRWQAVRSRLIEAGLAPPVTCPATGYLDKLPDYPYPIGVWMMPDCVSDYGRLEDLIQTLVPAGNSLWSHAIASTYKARRFDAQFTAVDEAKATLHCWLAWQRVPGLPYGTAINARYFSHDSPTAIAFLRWLKTLFTLDSLQIP